MSSPRRASAPVSLTPAPFSTTVVQTLINNARQASAGNDFTCTLVDGGFVKCTGYNDHGQLGLGHRDNEP